MDEPSNSPPLSRGEILELMFDPTAPLPKRAGQTDLTNDELLLFDSFFNIWAPLGALTRDGYMLHMDVRYTHSLEDDALNTALDTLVLRGLVAVWKGKNDVSNSYTLTPEGGRLWELERQVDWNRYCHDVYNQTEMVVTAARIETAENFLHAFVECRLVECDLTHIQQVKRANQQLVPWKVFPEAYELHTPYKSAGPILTKIMDGDWYCYESRRGWWRSIQELDTLKR